MTRLGLRRGAIALGCARSSSSPPSIGLQFPIECKLGRECFVLLYPDRDPSAGAIDYGCDRMTYDDHKGTDFTLPHKQQMQRGVSVIAVASGSVLRVQNGMLDPSGVKVATDVRVSDRPHRIAMGFIGKKFVPGAIPPGSWSCHYQLKCSGKSVISVNQTFQVSISTSMML